MTGVEADEHSQEWLCHKKDARHGRRPLRCGKIKRRSGGCEKAGISARRVVDRTMGGCCGWVEVLRASSSDALRMTTFRTRATLRGSSSKRKPKQPATVRGRYIVERSNGGAGRRRQDVFPQALKRIHVAGLMSELKLRPPTEAPTPGDLRWE
jgi:hypothetical protein